MGTELLGLEDPIDFEDEAVSKPSIQLNGVRVRLCISKYRQVQIYKYLRLASNFVSAD